MASVKEWNGLAVANLKTFNGLAKANVKSINDLAMAGVSSQTMVVGVEDNITYIQSTVPAGGVCPVMNITGFGFSIPTGSTISGIKAVIKKRKYGFGVQYIYDNTIKLIKGGSEVGSNYANTTYWAFANFANSIYPAGGGTSDLWGETWTPADINASNFGVAVTAKTSETATRIAQIDCVTITVYYS